MQRIWVVVLSVWAMLAIVAVLAWSSPPGRAAAARGRGADARRQGPRTASNSSSSCNPARRRHARDDVDVGGGADERPARAHRLPRRRHDLRRGRDGRAARRRDVARAALAAAQAEVAACERGALPLRPGQRPLPAQRGRRPSGPPSTAGSSRRCASRCAPARTPAAASIPTVLPALVAAGYDRSFEQLEERPARRADGWRAGAAIELDDAGRPRPARAGRRRRPRRHRQGLRGGARARRDARRVADAARRPRRPRRRHRRLRGETPEGGPWRVARRRPAPPGRRRRRPRSCDSRRRRHLRPRRRAASGPARSLHHLIDPATGEPAHAGTAHRHRRRAGRRRGGGARDRARDPPAGRRRRARRRAGRGSPRSTSRTTATPIPLGALPLAQSAHRREGRMTTSLPIAWLVARAAGLVAFGLLTLSVWLGLAMSTRLLGPKRQKSLLGLHRTLAWIGLSMVGLHVGALLLDPVLHFGAARGARPGRGAVEARRRRAGRRRRLAQPRARRLLPDAEVDRPEGLAAAALRELRARSRSRSGTRCSSAPT